MKAYEALVILDPTLSDDDRTAAIKRISEFVTADGGSLDKVDEWGKRKLAYEINKQTEGDYVLFEFHTQPSAINEINRVLSIADPVVRFIVVNHDEKSETSATSDEKR